MLQLYWFYILEYLSPNTCRPYLFWQILSQLIVTFVNMLGDVAERWEAQFQIFHPIICRFWMNDLKHACEDDILFSWFAVEQICEAHSDAAWPRFYHNTHVAVVALKSPSTWIEEETLSGSACNPLSRCDDAIGQCPRRSEEFWSRRGSTFTGSASMSAASWDSVGRRSFVVAHETQATVTRISFTFLLKQRGIEPPQPVTRPRENVVTSCAAKTWRDIPVVNSRRRLRVWKDR